MRAGPQIKPGPEQGSTARVRHQKVRANAKATTIKTCSDSKMQIGWGGWAAALPGLQDTSSPALQDFWTPLVRQARHRKRVVAKKKRRKILVNSGIRTRKIKVKCNSNLFAQLLNAAIAVAAVDIAAVCVAVAVAVGTRRIVCFVAGCCTFL